MPDIESFWRDFLSKNNLPPQTPYGGEFTFSNDEQTCCFLLSMILTGKKTAQVQALPSYDLDLIPLPQKGKYYVITDWKGNPVGILKTTNVTVLPFGEVTWELAQKDGEDSNLEEWREHYREFFEEDSEIMGYTFNMDMPVVFEEFCLMYKAI